MRGVLQVPRYDHGGAQEAKCADPAKCTGMTDGTSAVSAEPIACGSCG